MSIASTGAGVKNFAIGVAIFGAVGVVGYVAYQAYKVGGNIKDKIKAGADAVNPTNPENVFNRGFNWVVKEVTGKDSLYEVFNPPAPTSSPTARRGTTSGLSVQDLRNERAKIEGAISFSMMYSTNDYADLQHRLINIDREIAKRGG